MIKCQKPTNHQRLNETAFLLNRTEAMNQYKIWVPTGALGAGFPDESLSYAIEQKVDAIACDAGSTDSGPYYLGTGTSTKPADGIRADLSRMMKAREILSVPLIIGSCGTCGTDSGVDWVRDICMEIAAVERLDFKLALVYCEQDKTYLKQRFREGRITPLEGAPEISEAVFDACTHIVGVIGAEPIAAMLDRGADIILTGRATDTSLVAAPAMKNGIAPGAAWHGAKIVECGAQCTNGMHAGGAIITFDDAGFVVEAALPDVQATPYSVSAHMLYENADPYEMREPSGRLKARNAVYSAVNGREVRVENSEFEPMKYTIKLEGAGIVGYQTMIMAGFRDRRFIGRIDEWQSLLVEYIHAKVNRAMGLAREQYDIQVRRFGLDGVAGSGLIEEGTLPQELEIMVLVTAETQELASDIVKLANPYVLHMPLTMEEELPSFAFPFSPAQIDRGPVYEFKLHHVVEPDDYSEMIRTAFYDVKAGMQEEK